MTPGVFVAPGGADTKRKPSVVRLDARRDRRSAEPHAVPGRDTGPISNEGAGCAVALGSIHETSKELGHPIAKSLPFGQRVGRPARLASSQTFTNAIPHASGKTRCQ